MSHPAPPTLLPGDFLHPLGTRYTLELVAIIPPTDGHPGHLQCRRWGLSDTNQPTEDGHGHGLRYLHFLDHAGGARWIDPRPTGWAGHPSEYVHTPGRGQYSLF